MSPQAFAQEDGRYPKGFYAALWRGLHAYRRADNLSHKSYHDSFFETCILLALCVLDRAGEGKQIAAMNTVRDGDIGCLIAADEPVAKTLMLLNSLQIYSYTGGQTGVSAISFTVVPDGTKGRVEQIMKGAQSKKRVEEL